MRGRNSQVNDGDYVPSIRHSINSPIDRMGGLPNHPVLNKQSSRLYRQNYGQKNRIEPSYGSLGERQNSKDGLVYARNSS